jgi:integrase/recombinase XerD
MRTLSAKAKPAPSLRSVISATKKLWRQYHLSYDQTRYVSKKVRRALAIERTKMRQRVIARLSRDEEERLIKHAYRMKGERGLLIKTLFQTGARVSEFVNIKTEDVFFEEQMILIAKAKGGKSRYVPILPELAQELRTYLGQRSVGYLFETKSSDALLTTAHPVHCERNGGAGADHQARVSASPPALGGDNTLRAGNAH